MKKNAGIKILTGVVLFVVTMVLMNTLGKTKEDLPVKQDPNNLNEAIASQFNDNIRDVSARLIETEKKMRLLEKQNASLREKQEASADEKSSADKDPKQGVSVDVLNTIETLKSEIESLKATPAPDASNSYPVGLSNTKPAVGNVKDLDVLLMKHTLTEQDRAYWERLNARRRAVKTQLRKTTPVKKPSSTIPYYTVPAGADLGNTTLMSALIGEVPNEGKLMQPLFPFTAIISRGDLMSSNGVPLPPDISGMKVSGYAIGVGSFLDDISCVRAYVTSALFTFQDGHFVTVGQEEMKNTTDLVNNESLGYLTTPYGNPCIHGKYFTNAPRVLGAMMAAGGAEGVGNAISQWQMTYFAGANGVVAAPTGSFLPFAAGGAVTDGTKKAADWLEKRIQGSFDMVFVPASTPVRVNGVCRYRPNQMSLHITKTIKLDKQTKGRVLDYGQLQNYTHDTSLR